MKPKGSKTAEPAPEVLGSSLIASLAGGLVPAELSPEDRDAMHRRILHRVHDMAGTARPAESQAPEAPHADAGPTETAPAAAPPGTFTLRAADMRWVAAGPGVEVKVLRVDRERNDQTVLIRMQPGSVVVGHRHTQEEECLVLEGEVFIGAHRLGEGDMHVARPGVIHEPIRAPAGALLMIRSEMPPPSFRIA